MSQRIGDTVARMFNALIKDAGTATPPIPAEDISALQLELNRLQALSLPRDRILRGGDIASASSLLIGDNDYYHITGINSVSSLTPRLPGTVVWLEFDNSLTVFNSSNLILQNAVNFIANTGDVLTFISEGNGVWREIGRQLATSLKDDDLSDEEIVEIVSTALTDTDDIRWLYDSKDNEIMAYRASSHDKSDIQVFTTAGSGNLWTKPIWARDVTVFMIGGGGGGGSGRVGAALSARVGGSGGGGGGWAIQNFPASILGNTEIVTVGTGGAGGAVVSANDTNGNAGTAGTASSFGGWLKSNGGNAGAGGTAVNGTSGETAGGVGLVTGGTGSGGRHDGAGFAGNTSTYGGGGGGGAGGISAADVEQAGGAGGAGATLYNTTVAAGTAGAAAGGAGGTGTSVATNADWGGAGGGGGGGKKTASAGGAGGNGGLYGGGGGGGGAGLNATSTSGKGGTGGSGIVIVISV